MKEKIQIWVLALFLISLPIFAKPYEHNSKERIKELYIKKLENAHTENKKTIRKYLPIAIKCNAEHK